MNRYAIQQAISWLFLVGLLWSLFELFQPFFDALAWAAVIAIFFAPVYRVLLRRLKSPNLAAFACTVLVTLILIIPACLLLQALVREGIALFNDSSIIIPRVWSFLGKLESRIPWDLLPVASLQQLVDQVSSWGRANLASWSTRLAGNLAQVAFEVTVIVLALFYFFRDGRAFIQRLGGLSTLHERLQDRLLLEVAETVQVTVTALLLVSLIQGCLGAMIFWVLGLASPVLWGLMLGLSSVVPVFGTAIVWAPQGLWLMVNGETWKGITLLVFGAAIISSVDNVLRPFLITGRSQMNTLMVFIAVVGGIQAFGGVGTVLGPVLLSTASGLMRAYDEQSEIEAIPLQAIALTTE